MLDFSDTSFAEFFATELNIDINNPKYGVNGGSKGKRLRYFLQTCDDSTAVRALAALWEHRCEHFACTGRSGRGSALSDADRQAFRRSGPACYPSGAPIYIFTDDKIKQK